VTANKGTHAEEKEGCGPDPEKGSNIAECRVWASWGEKWESPQMTVIGRYECQYPNMMQIEVALIEVSGEMRGSEVTEKWTIHNPWDDEKGKREQTFLCDVGDRYLAWTWARYWFGLGGRTLWSNSSETRYTRTCEPEREVKDAELPPE
jgi:hypothetical protein